jgi:hypothetical protein
MGWRQRCGSPRMPEGRQFPGGPLKQTHYIYPGSAMSRWQETPGRLLAGNCLAEQWLRPAVLVRNKMDNNQMVEFSVVSPGSGSTNFAYASKSVAA